MTHTIEPPISPNSNFSSLSPDKSGQALRRGRGVRYSLLFFLLFLTVSTYSQPATDQQLGLQFYNNREFGKAAEVFERLYKNKPDHFTYTYYMQCLLELGETEEAAKLVKQQMKRYPEDAKYKVDQGYVLMRGNQGQKALKLFDDLIRELKPEQRSVVEMANAFTMRREYDYSVKTYLKGRQLLSPSYTFGFELAQLYEMQGQFDKMVMEYITLIEENPAYAEQVQARLQNSLLNDPENLKTEALRKALVMNVQKNPDNITLTEMLVWLSLQLKDFESALVQARALDRRLDENGSRVFALGQLSVSSGNYKVAADAFNYVMSRSDDPALRTIAEVELLRSEYELATTAYPVDPVKIKEVAGKHNTAILRNVGNPLTYPLVRNLAHIEAFYLDNSARAVELLEELINKTNNDRQLQAQCKLELADIMLFSGEPWEATLLYSQVDKAFKNDPLGHEARFRNARLSFYIGEFDWARAQLDVLKAATSKLIANDAMQMSLLISDNIEADSITLALASYARADLLLFRNRTDQALSVLDSILIAFPGHSITDNVLMKKAEIRMKQGDFAAAEALWKELLEQYPDDILADDALYSLASLYDIHLRDTEKAKEAYQKLMLEYPGSLYVVEARKRYRTLRGDFQQEQPDQISPPTDGSFQNQSPY